MNERAIKVVGVCIACGLLGACHPSVNINVGIRGDGRVHEASVGSGALTGDKIAIVEVRGLIQDGPRAAVLMEGANPVDRFVSALSLAESDKAVKAIVVRVSSPGGTVAASETMHMALREFSAKTGKPVVISMGEIAASGGYYIALAGDEIIAQPSTITGSIGVIVPTINAADGLAKIGIHSRAITSGPNKDIANPLVPEREAHVALLQGMVDDFYASFKKLVLERRPGLREEKIAEATDGRVFTGRAALEIGLVDRLGGLEEAIERAKERAGVTDARVVKYTDSSEAVQSPYANASAAASAAPALGATGAGTQVNVVQLNLGDLARSPGAVGTSGVYYLWMVSGW